MTFSSLSQAEAWAKLHSRKLVTCPDCGKKFYDVMESFPCDCGRGLCSEYETAPKRAIKSWLTHHNAEIRR